MRDREVSTNGAGEETALGSDAWEQELLRRFRQGDREAFGTLLRHYQIRVFSLVYRMVGRREEAEELMQEAFLQAFKSIERFPEVQPFRPWLFRVAVNVCRNHLRAAARRERPDDVGEDAEALWQMTAVSPEEEAHRSAEVQRLDAALSRLTWEERTLFLLRAMEGMSYEEIQGVLDASPNALRVRYHRVVQRLRGLLHGVIS